MSEGPGGDARQGAQCLHAPGPLDRLPPPTAWAVLLVVVALIIAGLVTSLAAKPITRRDSTNDAGLYARVIDRVRAGESYYSATVSEQRLGGYPLRPFVAVRPPLLTLSMAKLPTAESRRAAVGLLAILTFGAWAWRLLALRLEPLKFTLALIALASGIVPAFASQAYLFHEVWAGLLVALSLAVYRRNAWAPSLAIGLLAVLTRELAFPYLGVMAMFAVFERRWGEAAAWIVAMAVFAVALGLHAAAVGATTTLADPASQGWLGLDGLAGALRTAQWNVLGQLAPKGTIALLFPLALLGLLGWPDERGSRAAFLVFGYAAGFCVVGRPDTSYWGLLIAPLWPLGLITAGPALKTLMARARGG
jgi:hypothetical protein